MAFDAPNPLVPTPSPLVWRNAALDWAFYDVAALSPAEIGLLAAETTLEGAILVVHPNPWKAGVAVEKFEGLAAFRAAPGPRVERFAVAGIGGSDIGAAALARTLANRTGRPVGAVVSGYGAGDLWAEAAGGRFLFAGAASLPPRRARPSAEAAARALAVVETGDEAAAAARLGWDAATLLRLLREPERPVRTLLAHSRGGVALAFALNALAAADPAAFARLAETEVVTAGSAQPMPAGLGSVRQILGALDWYGEMNSEAGVARELAPRAWHHLNTGSPAHLDLGALL